MEALPLESVMAGLGLNEPHAVVPGLQPSLKLTVAPTSGCPVYGLVAWIRMGADSAVATVAVWALPPVTVMI